MATATQSRSKPKSARFPNAVLRVYFEEPKHWSGDWAYGHVTCSLAERDASYKTKPIDDSDVASGGDFSGVTITSQTDPTRLLQGACSWPMYAIDLGWKADRNNLEQAKRAVKALSVIEKRLDDLTETAGNPASFGAYVQRVAMAIGVGFAEVTNYQNERSLVVPTELAWRIDSRIDYWRRQARVAAGLPEVE